MRRSSKDAAAAAGSDAADLGQKGSHHGGTRAENPARCTARRQSENLRGTGTQPVLGRPPGRGEGHQRVSGRLEAAGDPGTTADMGTTADPGTYPRPRIH